MNKNQLQLLNVFKLLNQKIKNNDIIEGTVQLINHQLIFNPQYNIFNFQPYKKTNIKYAQLQLKWYQSQSLNCDMVCDVAKIWRNCADIHGNVNSNYGYLIYSKQNYNQYKKTLEQLKHNKNSRRAIMIYNRPKMHYDFNEFGRNDFICTMYNMFIIRNNKLHSIYNMRSNDIIYGLFNDYYWAHYVYHKLYNDLLITYPNLELGNIYWQACSLHAYQRHFQTISKIVQRYGK